MADCVATEEEVGASVLTEGIGAEVPSVVLVVGGGDVTNFQK